LRLGRLFPIHFFEPLFPLLYGEHAMTDSQHTNLADIAKHFDTLDDPRCPVNRHHPLTSVVVIAIMAILAGANGPTAIATWARAKEEFLRQGLCLPFGVPRKDVFRIVLTLLNPKVFQACFTDWLKSLRLAAMENLKIDRPIYGVDGKTLRRSHDHAKGVGALHAVSVWASELGLSLGQVACAEKSNEITAIPELLRLVDITGAIITIDAMGTQKAIAQQIVDGKADYVLALKGNQEKLHDAVIEHITTQLEKDFADVDARQLFVTETLHGHTETRMYTHMPVPKDLPMLDEWHGLKSIGAVVRCYQKDGQEMADIRYYISSLKVGVKLFARAVRGHWGIENGCHWTLDMTFREDESRLRGKKIRENFAWLNRLALSLLKQHPSKDSIAMKRRLCGWDDTFLLEVLTGITA
jgi:predicted transposase YbfD/YdcC